MASMNQDGPWQERQAIETINVREAAERLENARDRLYRDLLRLRNISASPAMLNCEKSIPVYLPSAVSGKDIEDYMGSVSNALYFAALHGELVRCAKCLTSLFLFWDNVQEPNQTMKDLVTEQDMLQKSRKAFSHRHNKWRKKFLESSGNSCRVCGRSEDLELAHITSVEDFFYKYRKGRRLRYPTAKYLGVEYSYRDDNLVILCRTCHDAQTMNWGIFYALEEPAKFIDLLHRRHKVQDLFEESIKKRGWKSSEDLHQKTLF